MSATGDYATMVLGNKGTSRPFSALLLVLALILILVRLPFMFSDRELLSSSAQTPFISMVEKSLAHSVTPFTDSTIVHRCGAFVVKAAALFTGNNLEDEKFRTKLFSGQVHLRQVVSAVSILLWLIISLAMYRYLETKIDDTVACFCLWMFAIAPAAMRATGTSPSVFLAPLICGVIVLSIELYDKETLLRYVLGGLLAGLALGFGLSNWQLLIPLLFAHFFSTRQPREGFFKLLFSLRLLVLMGSFLFGGWIACPSAVSLVRHLISDGYSITPMGIHLFNVLGSSDTGNQFLMLYQGTDPISVLTALLQVLGPIATIAAFVACIYTLFSSELGRFRPVSVYICVSVFFQVVSGYPDFRVAADLVFPLVLVLGATLLTQVNRFGFRFQKTIFLTAAVLCTISPVWVLYSAASPRHEWLDYTSLNTYMQQIIITGEVPAQVGIYFPSPPGTLRMPQPCLSDIRSQKIFEYWAKTLQPVSSLKKQGISVVVVNRQFLERLSKKLENEKLADRVRRIKNQLMSLEPVNLGTDEGFDDSGIISVRQL